jgi:DNA-binding NtrC family response regulator
MINNICNKSVLIVDDDAGLLRALGKVLASEGCKVTCATSVQDAIDILARQKAPMDLVITDLWMPVVTGLTGLYIIRTMFPEVPVIVLTAFGSPDFKSECLRLGAEAFLEKPLDTPQLLSAVEGALVSQKAGA